MICASLDDFFGVEPTKEDPNSVLKVLSHPCTICRLGEEFANGGMIWKGRTDAHIAVIGDMPNELDMVQRIAFGSGDERVYLDEWLEGAGIGSTDVFYTYIVQCQTPYHETKIRNSAGDFICEQRTPAKDEITRCFAPRCLRLCKALPNLEVVIALGITTLKVLLGGNPQAKTHHGFWFGSDLLPGVAIFGMPHPREFDNETGELKRGRVRQRLGYFKSEYFGRPGLGDDGITPRKIMTILAEREQERKEMKRV